VGGYAVMIYTEPSFTKDLDIWIDPTIENAQALFRALSEFGAPLKGISPKDFTEPEIFYQMGGRARAGGRFDVVARPCF
jgi:hypothetical protein